jgi:hypothetical protein
MACKGTCTVRIFDTQNLKPEKWPDYIDEATARRVLNGVVKEETQEEKETGCESDACLCVPLADYLPDEKGVRKKTPEWTAWRLRNVIDNIATDPKDVECVFGTVETRSAIVPGLCEKNHYVHLHFPKASGSTKQEGEKPKR